MCTPARRQFLGHLGRSTLIPLLPPTLAAVLSACREDRDLAPGMVPIRFDRDTCVRCSMVISDRRFAGQIRGGPQDTAFRFDDIGCLVFWLRDQAATHPWMADAATRIWVAEATSTPGAMRWLDPRQAHFVRKMSPMGYNFAALAQAEAGSLDFAGMRERVLAKGK